MASMIDEHTKTSADDDQLLSKISKSWCNNEQMKKTKNKNGSALIATIGATTTMTRIGTDIVILETTFRVIKIANGNPTTPLPP